MAIGIGRRWQRVRAARLVAGALAAAVLMILVLFALSLRQTWRDVWLDAQVQAESVVHVLEEHALKLLGSTELTLDQLAWMVADHGWAAFDSNPSLAARVRGMIQQPERESIWMADAQGDVRLQTLMPQPVALNLKEREWFKAPAESHHGAHVGRLVRGRVSGDPFLPVSKRIEDRDGAFLGVAQMSLRPAYFLDFYQTLAARGQAGVQLVHADGSLIARLPWPEGDPTSLREASYARAFAAQPARGVARVTSDLDGVERLIAYRQVGKYPIYVSYGFATATLRAEWTRRTFADAASTLPAVLIILGIGWFAYRKAGEVDAANRALEARVEARTEALNGALQQRTDILESISDAFFALDAEYRFTYANQRALQMWNRGRAEVIGHRLLEVFPQAEGSAIHAAYVEAMEGRRTVNLEAVSPVMHRWLSVTIYPAASGGLSVYFRDIGERKKAEQRQNLLAAEVDHRAKNMLALVQVMLRQTRAGSIQEYAAAAQGRVAALARAHALLAQSRWEGTDLLDLVADELAPYRRGDESRIEIAGPPVRLEPRLSQSLAMVVHELATNAAKYGALSVRSGRIGVAWSRAGDTLTLRWTESGGPPPRPPSRAGFGTGLIERTIRDQHGGAVRFDWREEGLVCAITLTCDLAERAALERSEA